MARKKGTRKKTKKSSAKRTSKRPRARGAAVNPLSFPGQGDQNTVSPMAQAQEASFEPYEGEFEGLRRHQPETGRSGVRKTPRRKPAKKRGRR